MLQKKVFINALSKHQFFEFLDSIFNDSLPIRDEQIDSWMSVGYGTNQDPTENRWGMEVLVDPDGQYRLRSLYRITEWDVAPVEYVVHPGITFTSTFETLVACFDLASAFLEDEIPAPSDELIEKAKSRL